MTLICQEIQRRHATGHSTSLHPGEDKEVPAGYCTLAASSAAAVDQLGGKSSRRGASKLHSTFTATPSAKRAAWKRVALRTAPMRLSAACAAGSLVAGEKDRERILADACRCVFGANETGDEIADLLAHGLEFARLQGFAGLDAHVAAVTARPAALAATRCVFKSASRKALVDRDVVESKPLSSVHGAKGRSHAAGAGSR